MNPAVRFQLQLTDAEWALIIELLQRERSELPPEIHHTRTMDVREDLHRRLELVENLLAKLAAK
jgi:hypothetical protein